MKIDTQFTWDSLSWDDLVWWHTLPPTTDEDALTQRKFALWLRLTGLRQTNAGEDVINEQFEPLYQFAYKKRKGEIIYATAHEVSDVVQYYMRFTDFPVGGKDKAAKRIFTGLLEMPRDTLRIFRRTFRLPSPMLANLTYQQYANAQKLTAEVATLMERAPKVKEEEEARRLARELMRARARVVAHLLQTPKLQFVSGGDGEGLRLDIRRTWTYQPTEAERLTPYIERHAPLWLFNIMQQHMQSCLAVYRQQFPELFSGGGEGSTRMPFISEADSVNAVMKWQGYHNQQTVYDSNAVFIFSILNSMTREAKAIEESNRKMKAKR